MADSSILSKNERYKARSSGCYNLGAALLGAIAVKLWGKFVIDQEALVWFVGAAGLIFMGELWLTLIQAES